MKKTNIKILLFLSMLQINNFTYAKEIFGLELNKKLDESLIIPNDDLYVLNLDKKLKGYRINVPKPENEFSNYYVGTDNNIIKQITAIGYEDIGEIDSEDLELNSYNENLSKEVIKYNKIQEKLNKNFGTLSNNKTKYIYFPSSILIKKDFSLSLKTGLMANDDNDIEHSYNIRIDYKTK